MKIVGRKGMDITMMGAVIFMLLVLLTLTIVFRNEIFGSKEAIENIKGCSNLGSLFSNAQGAVPASECVAKTSDCTKAKTPLKEGNIWQTIPFGCSKEQICCYQVPEDSGVANDVGTATKPAVPPCTEKIGGSVQAANARTGSCKSTCDAGTVSITSDGCASGLTCCAQSTAVAQDAGVTKGDPNACTTVYNGDSNEIKSGSPCLKKIPDCYVTFNEAKYSCIKGNKVGDCKSFYYREMETEKACS